jgi:hypothetical protein
MNGIGMNVQLGYYLPTYLLLLLLLVKNEFTRNKKDEGAWVRVRIKEILLMVNGFWNYLSNYQIITLS